MGIETTYQGSFRRITCLSTDTKPNPGAAFGFAKLRETDTGKEYYWDGVAWQQRSMGTEFSGGHAAESGQSATHTHATHDTAHANDHAKQHSVTSGADHTFPGGTTNFLRADGTFAAPSGGGGGGPTLTRKTANQTINGTAYQDITDLTFSLAINTTYHFIFYISFQSATTTTGFKFSVNGPTQSLLDYIVHYQTGGNAGTTADVIQRKEVTYDSMGPTGTTVTAAANLRCRIEGIIRTTAAGTLAARVGSELANNDLSVQAESVGILTTFT